LSPRSPPTPIHRLKAEAAEELDRVCHELFGVSPRLVPARNRHSREHGTFGIMLDERVVFATRRGTPEESEREAVVFSRLSAAGAPVPKFVAYARGWLFAESAGQRNLAQTLADAPGRATAILRDAVTSLNLIHEVAVAAELASIAPELAYTWRSAYRAFDRLTEIALKLGCGRPTWSHAQQEAAAITLCSPGRRFIKCDSRPANAALSDTGEVLWFDWQHVYCGWPASDVIWLLCDETVPDDLDLCDVLNIYLSGAIAPVGPEPLADYFAVEAVRYIAKRLLLVLDMGGLAADWEHCIVTDWPGSARAVEQLARNGCKWSSMSRITSPLAPWFQQVSECVTAREACRETPR
jgi:aminoglycoside phosphotransferase (APT) family kinase protein